MHWTDSLVVVVLVLAGIAGIVMHVPQATALLVALVGYRTATNAARQH